MLALCGQMLQPQQHLEERRGGERVTFDRD